METNISVYRLSTEKTLVLILPMRNGNWDEGFNEDGDLLGSYPTYEEWKL